MNSRLFMVLCLMITNYLCFGQSHYLIKRFDAYKDKNRIILNWSIKKGNSCVGIGILRSENDINYTKIGEIQGICGDNESETNYTFIDESPNHANYYVLELGASGITDPPLFVKFISLDGKASKVIPNPAVIQLTFFLTIPIMKNTPSRFILTMENSLYKTLLMRTE
ncbi:MAG: hypothetical protein IPN46_18895 [Saprospiraceae bacterium]|nr:hypothetical protein [Saprospiraceae bacterium]